MKKEEMQQRKRSVTLKIAAKNIIVTQGIYVTQGIREIKVTPIHKSNKEKEMKEEEKQQSEKKQQSNDPSCLEFDCIGWHEDHEHGIYPCDICNADGKKPYYFEKRVTGSDGIGRSVYIKRYRPCFDHFIDEEISEAEFFGITDREGDVTC